MKTILSTTLLLLTVTLTLTPVVRAQGIIQDNFDTWTGQVSTTLPTTIDAVINRLIPLLIALSGLVLLVMLIWGGFQMLTAGTNPEAAEAGKKTLTAAIFGFVVIITAFWIVQILEIIFGIKIFSA
jgi:hypothetical protein